MRRSQPAAILGAVAVLNVVAWVVFLLAVLPDAEAYRGLGLGVAVTAWTLGARHAFDADHIAAIDTATRKLLADGRPAAGTGVSFALGHACVVVLLAVGVAFAGRTAFDAVAAPGTWFDSTAGVVATAFAAGFLLLMAAVNLVVLAGIVRSVRDLRRGRLAPRQLEEALRTRGVLLRVLGPLMRTVTRSRHMFVVGAVFGISFETATEVLLLAGVAAAAGDGLPWVAVLSLPLLFAAGLTLFDSLNGVCMAAAYRWAFARPARRLFYNAAVTAMSVAVAVLVGGVQAIVLAAEQLQLRGWLADAAGAVDLEHLGFAVVALFAAVWLSAVVVWRVGRVEARWEASLAQAG